MDACQHQGVSTVEPRPRYHHGDLRNALVAAATDLAEKGGPEAVVLRAAAREVGVSPTAAYRHFASQDDLLTAVKRQAGERLAETMATEVRAARGSRDPLVAARRRLGATGRGYLRFAMAEPGAFRTFCAHSQGEGAPLDDSAFSLLTSCLDDLVAAGGLPAARRPYSELVCWAAVHGLAMLVIDGPIGELPPRERDRVIDRLVQVVLDGL